VEQRARDAAAKLCPPIENSFDDAARTGAEPVGHNAPSTANMEWLELAGGGGLETLDDPLGSLLVRHPSRAHEDPPR